MISDIMASAYCEHCSSLFRVERTPLTGRTGPFIFCPLCGSPGITLSSAITTDEYWEALGREYGMPADIMREIFNTWNTSEFATLREHIESLQREVLEGVR